MLFPGKSTTLKHSDDSTTDRRYNKSVGDKFVEKKLSAKPNEFEPEDRKGRPSASFNKYDKYVIHSGASTQATSSVRRKKTSSTAAKTTTSVAVKWRNSKTVGYHWTSASANIRKSLLANVSQVAADGVRNTSFDKLRKQTTNLNDKYVERPQRVKSTFASIFKSLSSVSITGLL